MNRGHKKLFLALMAGALTLLPAGWSWAQAQQNPAAEQQEAETEYTEEEYNAYEAATNEPDLSKREAALLEFMEQYPESKLQVYIVNSYQTLLYEYQKSQNYEALEQAAEKWLKYFPNELQAVAYVAEAAQKLGHNEKFLEYGQRIYSQKPSAQLASYIYETYEKMGNTGKQEEWAQKLFEYPEFKGNFKLRMYFCEKYANEKDLAKAADYARRTLTSLEAAQKPEETTAADWSETQKNVKKYCNNIIGMQYYDQQKYSEAITFLQRALKAEQYDAAYYFIALSLWKLDKVEDAINSFAKAELLKGDMQTQAKENLEKLYKALHNNTTIGIEKVYKKAQTELAEERTEAM